MEFLKRFSDVCILTQIVLGVVAIVAQSPDGHDPISGFQFLMLLFFCIFALVGAILAACLKNWKRLLIQFVSPVVLIAAISLVGSLTRMLFN